MGESPRLLARRAPVSRQPPGRRGGHRRGVAGCMCGRERVPAGRHDVWQARSAGVRRQPPRSTWTHAAARPRLARPQLLRGRGCRLARGRVLRGALRALLPVARVSHSRAPRLSPPAPGPVALRRRAGSGASPTARLRAGCALTPPHSTLAAAPPAPSWCSWTRSTRTRCPPCRRPHARAALAPARRWCLQRRRRASWSQRSAAARRLPPAAAATPAAVACPAPRQRATRPAAARPGASTLWLGAGGGRCRPACPSPVAPSPGWATPTPRCCASSCRYRWTRAAPRPRARSTLPARAPGPTRQCRRRKLRACSSAATTWCSAPARRPSWASWRARWAWRGTGARWSGCAALLSVLVKRRTRCWWASPTPQSWATSRRCGAPLWARRARTLTRRRCSPPPP